MIVACGISTPTSMTVVATRICVAPSAKAAIAASLSRLFILPWTSPTLIAEDLAQMRETLLRGGDIELFAFFDERADPEGAGALCQERAGAARSARPCARAAGRGSRPAAARRAFPANSKHPCRRNRSAPKCAEWASRSSREYRRPRSCRPRPGADARRNDAAHRRRQGRDRGRQRFPETRHECRSRYRCVP